MDPFAGMPSTDALQGLMEELEKTMASLPDTQRKLMALRGVGWSDDRLVKAEVGPRGQLVDLEIDPRVFRRPDAQGLQSAILAAVNAAVTQVAQQTQEILQEQLPAELPELRAQFRGDATDPLSQMLVSDADLRASGSWRDD